MDKDQLIESIPARIGYDLTHSELFLICQLLDQKVTSLANVPVISIEGRTYHEVCEDIRHHNNGFSPEYLSTLQAFDHVLMFNMRVENRKRNLRDQPLLENPHHLLHA